MPVILAEHESETFQERRTVPLKAVYVSVTCPLISLLWYPRRTDGIHRSEGTQADDGRFKFAGLFIDPPNLPPPYSTQNTTAVVQPLDEDTAARKQEHLAQTTAILHVKTAYIHRNRLLSRLFPHPSISFHCL